MTICSEVNDLVEKLESYKSKLKNIKSCSVCYKDGTAEHVDLESVVSNITNTIKRIEKIRKSGQKMENRLESYYDAIRGLGFKRCR